jgi:ferredoxin
VVLAPADAPHELPALVTQAALLAAFLDALGYQGPRVHILAERDPEAVEAALYSLPALPELAAHSFSAIGTKRDIARTVLAKLRDGAPKPADLIPLPGGAPYGRIHIRTEGCTLCLACVGACPANALSDHPDRPQVAVTEAACVQCGVCVATCPEKVITLEPRYNFSPAALSPDVLKAEEPFRCVSCGKPFGTKASIERVAGRLKGHAMFKNERQLRLIQMCDTCRIVAVAAEGGDPLKGPDRPRMRTTEDYLEDRAEAQREAKTPEDFLG